MTPHVKATIQWVLQCRFPITRKSVVSDAGDIVELRVLGVDSESRRDTQVSLVFVDPHCRAGLNCKVDLSRMVTIILTSTPWIVNIYAVQLLLMYTFTVLGMPA